jgi:N-methylhydantoinase A/oxoprolinase/acetone carboxylase beta subunit
MSDIYEMAAGVIDICNTNMYGAIREVSIERGSHPADLALVAFGGAGGLHAIAVADRLDMPRVVVPRNAGIFSALGLLAADPRRDMVQPYLRPLSAVDFEDVGSQLLVMGNKARDMLKAEGLNETDIDIEYRFGMRYAGQIYEEEVVAKSPTTDYEQLAADFGNLYEGKYGFRREPEFAELINLRVVGIGRTAKPDLARALVQQSPAEPGDTTIRQAT